MEKQNPKEPKITILPDHEKIEAEEYVEDVDHVYRKKEEVLNRLKGSSTFWMRLVSFLGLTITSLILIFKLFKLLVGGIQAALHGFSHLGLNRQVKQVGKECFSLIKIILGLSVSVINPQWGKRLIALFFSMKDQKVFHNFFRFSTSF